MQENATRRVYRYVVCSSNYAHIKYIFTFYFLFFLYRCTNYNDNLCYLWYYHIIIFSFLTHMCILYIYIRGFEHVLKKSLQLLASVKTMLNTFKQSHNTNYHNNLCIIYILKIFPINVKIKKTEKTYEFHYVHRWSCKHYFE